ncbi:MAG: dihydroorotase [Bacteroidota bacterium]
METLILNATVCFPASPFNSKVCDILIVDNQIETIALSSKKVFDKTSKKQLVFDAQKAIIAPSFVDLRSHGTDPGNEQKETLETLAKTAIAGGFTTVCVLPDSEPTTTNKAQVEYIVNQSNKLAAEVLPYGTLSHKMQGEQLSEMYDMHLAGAVGFSDANHAIKESGLMMRALQYSQIFGAKLFIHAEDLSLSTAGRMHEGKTSVVLGLKGIPAIAEEMAVKRDIELAKYCNAPIHFSHISSKGSVEIIKRAKAKGIPVTCDVAVANLCYIDEDLMQYNANLKLNPPLRGRDDRKALWNGLLDGTIDAIVTDHLPQNLELKEVEFEYASEGMIMLQTALPLLLANAPKNLDLTILIEKLSINPRKIINKAVPAFEKGAQAEFVIFNTQTIWLFNSTSNQSKSKNSFVFNKELTGKVLAVFNKQKLTIL